jgi:hypothetical protein
MDSFLADTLTKMNGMGSDELDTLRQRFDASMEVNFALFEKHAFRKSLVGDAGNARSSVESSGSLVTHSTTPFSAWQLRAWAAPALPIPS